MEKELQGIWKEVLQLDEDPGVDESFFDLGGNSFFAANAAQMTEEKLGVHLEIPDFYDHETISAQVKLLSNNGEK